MTITAIWCGLAAGGCALLLYAALRIVITRWRMTEEDRAREDERTGRVPGDW